MTPSSKLAVASNSAPRGASPNVGIEVAPFESVKYVGGLTIQNAQATVDRYPRASGCCADHAAREDKAFVNPYVRNEFFSLISAFGTGVPSGSWTTTVRATIAGAGGSSTSILDVVPTSTVATAVWRNAPF